MSDKYEARKKELRAKMDSLKAQAKKQAETFFKENVKELFDENPELDNFSWRQYTVYFNDGDECYFSAHTDSYSVDVNGICDEDECSVYSLKEDIKKYKGKPEVLEALQEDLKVAEAKSKKIADLKHEVARFLQCLDCGDYKALFGDHVSITVSRDGITVEDYTDHD